MIPFPIINTYSNEVIAPGIKKVQGRSSHIGILYNTGELYLRGDNSQGELGTGDKVNIYTSWYLARNDVTDFWVGLYTTLVRTTDNKFFFVGQMRHYGLAIDASNVTVWTEVTSKFSSEVGDISTIKSIELGNYSSLILRTDGNLYGAGTNGWGELGFGTISFYSTYTLTNTSVNKIFLSTVFSYIIKNDGTLWSTGHNQVGQLGCNSTATYLMAWTACTFANSNSYVKDVGLGFDTAYIIASTSSTGVDTYSACGANNNGRLGIGTSNTFYRTFTALPSSTVISKFNTGVNEITTSNTLITNLGVSSAGPAALPSGLDSASSTFRAVTSTFTDLNLIKSVTLCGGLSTSTQQFQLVLYGDDLYALGGSDWLGRQSNIYTKIASPK